MGVSRSEMRDILTSWQNPSNDEVLSVVRSALNNLIGYPHEQISKVEEMMGLIKKDMITALNKIPRADLR